MSLSHRKKSISQCMPKMLNVLKIFLGNSSGKLRHTRAVAYSVELVVLNKHQITRGGAYLDCYLFLK